jgi:glycerol-3-phosphate dehydrogenase (NAD(P)+)
MRRIGVIGAGKWGSGLAFAFKEAGSNVSIYSRSDRGLENYKDIDEILKEEYLLFAIPTQAIKPWLKENFKFKNQKILVASKGIDNTSLEFLDSIFREFVPSENLAFLSGPSFASEVMQKLPTAVMINSSNISLAEEFCLFFPDFIKTYTSSDVIGAEICGSYKNVLAIAGGISDGLALGNNAKSALIARGLVEMARFGKFFGAKDETFLGLSGAGDLFLTSNSILSRNYRVGINLAKEKNLDEILKELGEVAEGVYTAKAIYELSQKNSIYTPIATEVYLILDGKNPKDSLNDLLRQ